jgi:hypothetical protein
VFKSDRLKYTLTCAVFVCRGPEHKTAVTSVVRYDPESNITFGYILSGRASEIHYTLLAIPTQFDLCVHPLLIPVLMAEQLLEVSHCLVSGVHARLRLIEQNIEKKKWINEPRPARDFYKGNAHWLSNETRSFGFCKAQMHAVTLRNSYLAQELGKLDTWMPVDRLGDLQKSTSLLKQRIAYNRSNIEHLSTFLGVEIRLDALKTLVSVLAPDNRPLFIKDIALVKGKVLWP